MSSISNSSSIFYQRDMTLANEVHKETSAIYPTLNIAYDLAKEVANQAPALGVAPRTDLSFRVTKEFLVCVVERAAADISNQTPGALSEKNLTHLRKFFSDLDLSFSIEFKGLHQRVSEIEKKTAIANALIPLQLMYREATGRFIRSELVAPIRPLSCFHYAIDNAGLTFEFFPMLLAKKTQPTDFVDFLRGKNMGPSPLPFQKGDIVIYFDDANQPLHAAVVLDAEKKICSSKFGNALPFAYNHYLDEMPPSYGGKFQIYRKPLPNQN
ncbi:MAG: hypothetical protein JSS32_02655 [Verrucomicrobia bacterium]|nr:hypothetical protein [Verrucomicrobiota bacterium]